MTQKEYLSKLSLKGWIVGSLGTISKDLPDGKKIIKVKGAMGCVLGVGLGIALSTAEKVRVIVGEGAYLMKLGSMATILAHKPKNLEIIVLNNGKYASTGGQENNFKHIKKYLKLPRVKYENIC